MLREDRYGAVIADNKRIDVLAVRDRGGLGGSNREVALISRGGIAGFKGGDSVNGGGADIEHRTFNVVLVPIIVSDDGGKSEGRSADSPRTAGREQTGTLGFEFVGNSAGEVSLQRGNRVVSGALEGNNAFVIPSCDTKLDVGL